MTVAYPPARTGLQFTGGNVDQQLRSSAEVVNNILAGWTNTTLFVTLDAGSATTTVMHPRISAQTTASFSPTSASAAAEIPTLWVEMSARQMLIHHTLSGIVDRTYNVSISG